MKKGTRPMAFQPKNKASLTSVVSIDTVCHAIPSFRILALKELLEEYT